MGRRARLTPILSMSLLQIIAVALGIANVGLLVRRNIGNFPLRMAMVALCGAIFWQARLYGEAGLPPSFFAVQAWGWRLWARPAELMAAPKADIYLLLEPDLPWVDDGTRIFSDAGERHRFAKLVEQVLVDAGVRFVRICGHGNERLAAARAALGAINA